MNSLILQHALEEEFAVASSLHALVDIEVQNGEGVELDDLALTVANKQLLEACFEEADAFVALDLDVDLVPIRSHLSQCGDRVLQPLSLCKGYLNTFKAKFFILC